MMALAVENDMIVEQLDVTTAYLNGTLKEKIYMEIPKYLYAGLNILAQTESTYGNVRRKALKMIQDLKEEDKVCLLNKSIYGLLKLDVTGMKDCNILSKFGAQRSSSDPCIFFKGCKQDLILIAIYVNDILIASQTDLKSINSKSSYQKDSR